jgi:hypothetical protein
VRIESFGGRGREAAGPLTTLGGLLGSPFAVLV